MSSDKSRWQLVYGDLRRRIDASELTPGAQVPAELDLAEQHQVSRQTVRSALTRLQQEGLITAGRGKLGRTVRVHEPLWWHLSRFENRERRDDPATGMDDWAAGVAEQGRSPRQEVAVTIEPAPIEVSSRLHLEEGELAVRRHRTRYVDDQPYQLSDSWFPRDIAEGTALMDNRDVAMPGGIMQASGRPQARTYDEIGVRMPTPDEAERLDLPMGTPVGQHVRTGYDKDDRPIRVMITIFSGDRHYLVYEQDLTQ